MVTLGINIFALSWRGFLVGSRRGWHAYHRSALGGYRGGTLIVNLSFQTLQIRRVASLLVEIFARGGRIWAFGLGQTSQQKYPWGVHRSWWSPGVVSNYFPSRVRRLHFTQHLQTTLQGARRVTRQEFSKLSHRWRRLYARGGLPCGVYPRWAQLGRFFLGGLTSGVAHLTSSAFTPYGAVTLQSQPHAGWARSRWFRQWWNLAPRLRSTLEGSLGWPRRGPHGIQGARIKTTFNQKVARLYKVNQQRFVFSRGHLNRTPGFKKMLLPTVFSPPRGVPGWGRSFRGRHRWVSQGGNQFQRWPFGFPSVLVGGGFTLLGTTLLNEVASAGTFLIYWGGSDSSPHRTGLLSVLWNQSSRSLEGVRFLMEDFFSLAGRLGLLRVVWGRLGA